MLHNKNYLNERGTAFIWVLLTIIVLSILGISILSIGLSNTKNTIYQEDLTKAHYAARAGAEEVFADINADRSNSNINNIISSGLSEDLDTVKGIRYETQVVPSGGLNNLLITSTGYVGDDISKSVTLKISRDKNYYLYAMFGDLSLDVGGTIKTEVHDGDVATNATSHTGNITFDPSDNDVQYGVEHTLDPVRTELFSSAYPFEVGDGELNLQEEYVAMLVDVGSVPKVFLVTDSINLVGGSNKSIAFSGNGEIHLLVRDTFNLGGTCSITTDNADGTKLFLYFLGSEMTIGGTIDIDGVIYVPNGEFRLNGGGNAIINGSINAKTINLNGGVIDLNYISDLNSDPIDKSFNRVIWMD